MLNLTFTIFTFQILSSLLFFSRTKIKLSSTTNDEKIAARAERFGSNKANGTSVDDADAKAKRAERFAVK